MHINFAIQLENATLARVATPPPATVPGESTQRRGEKRDGKKNTDSGSASALKHKKKAGDEHDKKKTNRRSQTMSSMSEPFVGLFEASQRLVTIKCPELGSTKMVDRFRSGMKGTSVLLIHNACCFFV
jgi:hypothetical protein